MPAKKKPLTMDDYIDTGKRTKEGKPVYVKKPKEPKVAKPPGNRPNSDLYTPKDIDLTESQQLALLHAAKVSSKGLKLKKDSKAEDKRPVKVPLTAKQHADYKAGRTISLSNRQMNMMIRGGFITGLLTMLAENPALGALALEVAKPVAQGVGRFTSRAIDKVGDALGLGVTPQRARVKRSQPCSCGR